MLTRLRSLEQLMPFATAGELLMQKRQSVVAIAPGATAAMASGGMDALPHNGAVITLLGVTGLTHKQSYRDIFAITLVKTAAVAVVIGLFYVTGIH